MEAPCNGGGRASKAFQGLGTVCAVSIPETARFKSPSGVSKPRLTETNHIQTNSKKMNTKKSLLLASMLAAITALSSVAQSTPPTPPTTPPTEKPARPERPQGGRGPGVEVPRIGVPDNVLSTLPQALQDQISKYREQSKTFIDAQRELAKTLSAATEEQRNTIREQLKANRDKFLTDTQQVRTEIRDQLKDLGVAVRENKPTDGGGTGGGKGPGRPRG